MNCPFYHLVPKDLEGNLRWRKAILERVNRDPEFAEVIWQACERDPLFYINTFVWTYDPRRKPHTKIPMITYGYQDEAILELIAAIGDHDICVEKSRDMGASWICLIVFEWLWHFRPLQSFLMVSRTESYVDEPGNPKSLFWKVDFIHQNLPLWLMPKGYDRTKHRKKLHLRNPANGSVIDGESTTGDVARGDRRTAILLDEFAAVAEGHRVLKSTRDATTTRIFNSTPQGTGNAYYDIVQTSILKLRFHWAEHPLKRVGLYTKEAGEYVALDREYWDGIDEPTAEMERLDGIVGGKGVELHDGKLRSIWYAEQCERAAHSAEIAQELDIDYLGSGFQFFSGPQIEDYARRFTRRPVAIGDLEWDLETAEPDRFRENSKGRLRLWIHVDGHGEVPTDRRYVVGADISAGTGASNSCLSILDTKTGEKVGEYVNPNVRPELFGRTAVAICRWLGGAFLLWESNGPGRQFGDAVVETGYRNIYRRRAEQAISKKVSDIPGFAPTRENKLVLLGEYRRALETESFINRSSESLRECLEYVFLPNGSVQHSRSTNSVDPSGAKDNHGDRVIADALAWKGVKDRPQPKKSESNEPPYGSFAWRRKQWEKQQRERDYWGAA